jgi:hypothetical protein
MVGEELDRLRLALQEYLNTTSDQPILLDNALIVWEQIKLDGDDTLRQIQYVIPTDNFSLSGTLGLLEASATYIRRDILGSRDEEET